MDKRGISHPIGPLPKLSHNWSKWLEVIKVNFFGLEQKHTHQDGNRRNNSSVPFGTTIEGVKRWPSRAKWNERLVLEQKKLCPTPGTPGTRAHTHTHLCHHNCQHKLRLDSRGAYRNASSDKKVKLLTSSRLVSHIHSAYQHWHSNWKESQMTRIRIIFTIMVLTQWIWFDGNLSLLFKAVRAEFLRYFETTPNTVLVARLLRSE